MSKIFTPTNQIKLTNVAIVRIKKTGKRFEIACYRNKVLSWREKIEKDIEEVLQTHTVFTNVSKGQVAKREDLYNAFGTDNVTEVCKIILNTGELQISDRERQKTLESTLKDIATIISEKCINPETRLPYPSSIIEKAMKDIHFSIKPTRNAKQQALEVISQLKSVIPLERAQMRLKLIIPKQDAKKAREILSKHWISLEDENTDSAGNKSFVCLIDPGVYRAIHDTVAKETKGHGIVEVINLKEVAQGEEFV